METMKAFINEYLREISEAKVHRTRDWQHRLSTGGSVVAISHVNCRNWPYRLSSASQITY